MPRSIVQHYTADPACMIVNEHDDGYTVNLATHQCACRRWDLTGIPCKHAVSVLDDNQEDPIRYTSEYYYAHMMRRTYSDNIKPVNGGVCGRGRGNNQ